jgi:hypothetical protein
MTELAHHAVRAGSRTPTRAIASCMSGSGSRLRPVREPEPPAIARRGNRCTRCLCIPCTSSETAPVRKTCAREPVGGARARRLNRDQHYLAARHETATGAATPRGVLGSKTAVRQPVRAADYLT